jgi:hypothetical protein
MRRLAIAALLVTACNENALQTGADLGEAHDLAVAVDGPAVVFDLSWSMDGGVPWVCATASGEDECAPDSQYCYWYTGGGAHGHGTGIGPASPESSPACMELPTACLPNPTCACLMANAPGYCPQCYASGRQLVLVCAGI